MERLPSLRNPFVVQGQATETFFEAAVREASEGQQQPSPVEEQPSPVEEQSTEEALEKRKRP